MASTTITDADQAAISRDVTRHTLTRPRIVVIWLVLALVLVLEIAGIAVQAAHGEVRPGLSWIVTVAAVVMPVYLIVSTVRATRRSVRAAFPADSVVTADATAGRLAITTVRGTVDVALDAFRGCAVLGTAVLLRQRGSRVGIVVPRAALDPGALEHLRSGAGGRW